MRNLKIILGIGVVLLALSVAWQIGACEIANVELRDDLRDLTAQLGVRSGLQDPKSVEEMRSTVVHKAKEHGIELGPEQVTVVRTGVEERATFYLAVDYMAPIRLPGYSFWLHFTPSSGRRNS